MFLLSILHHPDTTQAELILEMGQDSPRFVSPYTTVIADAVTRKFLYRLPMFGHYP